jgi:uncharacterized protein
MNASSRPWLPYVAPMVTFLLLTFAEGYLPKSGEAAHPTWYPVAYAVKILIVAAVLWVCRSALRDLKPWPRPVDLALAVGLGLGVTAIWVGLEKFYPHFEFLGSRSKFDPTTLAPPMQIGFLIVRFLGLVVIVPVMEEIFWRSFLIRWIIDPEFTKVPIGRVTPAAAAITSVLFALAHPEWFPALLTGFAWAWLLWQTKSLSACVVSHMTANLGLGVYVLATADWKYL